MRIELHRIALTDPGSPSRWRFYLTEKGREFAVSHSYTTRRAMLKTLRALLGKFRIAANVRVIDVDGSELRFTGTVVEKRISRGNSRKGVETNCFATRVPGSLKNV